MSTGTPDVYLKRLQNLLRCSSGIGFVRYESTMNRIVFGIKAQIPPHTPSGALMKNWNKTTKNIATTQDTSAAILVALFQYSPPINMGAN